MNWPSELDAVIAAPEHHRLALENDEVRVLETRIRPGETVNMHTHQWFAAAYIVEWSDCVRRDEDGVIVFDSRRTGVEVLPGMAMWTNPLGPHTLENVGTTDLHIITVEVKRA